MFLWSSICCYQTPLAVSPISIRTPPPRGGACCHHHPAQHRPQGYGRRQHTVLLLELCGGNGAANQDSVVPAENLSSWKVPNIPPISQTPFPNPELKPHETVSSVSTPVALTVWHNKKGSLILSPKYSMHFDGSNWLFASFILKPRFLTWFNTIMESVVTCFCEWEHTR